MKMLQLGLFFISVHVSKAAGLTLHHHLFISTSTDSVTTAKDRFSLKTRSQIDPNRHVVKWHSFLIISNIPNTDYLYGNLSDGYTGSLDNCLEQRNKHTRASSQNTCKLFKPTTIFI